MFDAPIPLRYLLPSFKSPTSVQVDPFHVSVKTLAPGPPPNASVAVFGAPSAPAIPCLASFQSPTSVHEVPFQVSVSAVLGWLPPKDKAAVAVPYPADSCTAVFKSPTSVQLEPFQDSV